MITPTPDHQFTLNEKRGYLDWLYNKYGAFEVASSKRLPDGDVKWSQWKDYMLIRDSDSFVMEISHRTILDCEIVLDAEDKDTASYAYHILKAYEYKFKQYDTGSRGCHFHLIFPELKLLTKHHVKSIKDEFIAMFSKYDNLDVDKQKSTQRCMIALEGTPHWKSNKPKVLVSEFLGNNQVQGLVYRRNKENGNM